MKGADEYNTDKAGAEAVAIETPDDKTMSVELIAKSPFFLQLTSFATYFPQQQEFVEKLGDKYARDGDSLLYNGPYIMTAGSEGGGSTVVLQEERQVLGQGKRRREDGQRPDRQGERHGDQPVRGRRAGPDRPRRATRSSSIQDSPDFFRTLCPLPSTGG